MVNELQEPQSWRELLSQRIADPRERQRIAQALNIHAITLQRWTKGDSIPRSENFQRLPMLLPAAERDTFLQLLKKEQPDYVIIREGSMMTQETSIPNEFYVRIIQSLRTTPKDILFWTLGTLIVQQAVKQCDPQRKGIAIYAARCMPPRHQKVHSLREIIGCGTDPWENDLTPRLRLLGAESLAGYAVAEGALKSNHDLRDLSSREAGIRDPLEVSAVATPIMRSGAIAGALIVSSAQPDYFVESIRNMVEEYAGLLGVIFESSEFYERKQIALGALPAYEVQQQLLINFRERVEVIMREATQRLHPLNAPQAEQIAWQQIEEELLSV